jgi:PPM family protein phosphatase
MMRIEAAGATDTGQVRPANEDAYLVGDSVFAVADGMGGHLAGEVASATALEPVEELDGKVYSDAADAVKALREAVVSANDRVSQMATDEPSYRGMGTTLTATMVEGKRVHIAHVGDSRAYLLRGGSFSQLTDDHTLVQHLVDEGQITREEAASHPQRSIITRAIGVSREVDVDSMTLDLEPGDQLLLCSDGLTGVVDDQAIAQELSSQRDAQETLQRLIEAANDGGGPDNITAILLRVTSDEQPSPPGGSPVVVTTRDAESTDDWARRLGNYGSLGRGSPWDGEADDDDRGGRKGKILAIVFGVLLLVGLLAGGAYYLLSQEYFLGLDDEDVVIYQGLDLDLGPLELARIVERTGLTADDVQPWYRDRLEDGVPAAGLSDARVLVEDAPLRADTEDDADATADDEADDEADEETDDDS